MKVLVCGAGGFTGGAVVSALAGAGFEVSALVRREERRAEVLARGASSVVIADYDDAGSLDIAMKGMEAVFFVAPSYREEEPRWVAATVEAAERAGAERFVYQSVLHPHTPSMPHHVRKAGAEVTVRESRLRWVILQPAMYAQTVFRTRQRSAEGRIDVPYAPEAPFTVVDVRDVGAAVASVLADDEFAYGSYEIVGAELLTFAEMAATMNRVLGERRELVEISPRSLPLPRWDERQREEYALMCEEYGRNGLLGSAAVTRMLLGREPASFAEVVKRDGGRA